ncbi:uncharacterized protein LOC119457750 [Dermacentor silvarum]|uniref:uncharacterized protein LOC119457750 n=1 Tax=Dermacentor silvarum TaxID=543639 RepID=UPI0018982AEC|nr:uncharacterized protein LOC119457750 [Dermacentor silvarum]
MKLALITVTFIVAVIIITEVELAKPRRIPKRKVQTGNRRQPNRSRNPRGPKHPVGKPGSRQTGNQRKPNKGHNPRHPKKPGNAGHGPSKPANKPAPHLPGHENAGPGAMPDTDGYGYNGHGGSNLLMYGQLATEMVSSLGNSANDITRTVLESHGRASENPEDGNDDGNVNDKAAGKAPGKVDGKANNGRKPAKPR